MRGGVGACAAPAADPSWQAEWPVPQKQHGQHPWLARSPTVPTRSSPRPSPCLRPTTQCDLCTDNSLPVNNECPTPPPPCTETVFGCTTCDANNVCTAW